MSYIGNTPGVSSQRVVLEEVISGSPKSVFTPISGYIKGYVDVLINGHELDTSDFTADDGVTVSLVEAAAVGDTVKVKTWLPRGLSDGYLKTEADARFLNLAGGTLTGGLTAAGNFLMTANAGNARVVGVSNGTNTTLVLQGGGNGAGALGGNIELGRDGNNMYDATVSRFRSLDGSTQYGQFDATGFSFANYLTGGSVPLARLSVSGTTALTGTASASTFLRGDGAWIALDPTPADGSITAAKLSSGAAAGNLGFTPLRPSNNLSDLGSAGSARNNIGLPVYDSGWYSVAKDTSYVKTHSLGSNNLLILNYFSYDASNAAFVTYPSFHSSSHLYTGGCVIADINGSTFTVRTGWNDVAGPSPYPNTDTMRFGGVDHLTSGGITGYYRTIAIRLG